MGRNATFASELRKIAGIPAPLVFGGLGGIGAALFASRNTMDRQRADEDRAAMGLISPQELRRRRDLRVLHIMGGASLGMAGGALIPAASSRAREWVRQTSREASEAAERSFRRGAADVKEEYSDALRSQVDYAMDQVKRDLPGTADAAGRRAGKGFLESLYEGSVTQGKSPAINLQLRYPWSRSRG